MNKKYSKSTLFALTIGAVLFVSNRGGSPGGRTGSTTDAVRAVQGLVAIIVLIRK